MFIKNLLAHKFLLTLVVVSSCLIIWGSLAKFVMPFGIRVEGSDKIAHLVTYFVFANILFLFLFYSEKLNINFKQSLVSASIIGFCLGILMELLQAFLTNYRTSDWYDIMANTSGIVIADIFLKVFEGKLIKLKNVITRL